MGKQTGVLGVMADLTPIQLVFLAREEDDTTLHEVSVGDSALSALCLSYRPISEDKEEHLSRKYLSAQPPRYP